MSSGRSLPQINPGVLDGIQEDSHKFCTHHHSYQLVLRNYKFFFDLRSSGVGCGTNFQQQLGPHWRREIAIPSEISEVQRRCDIHKVRGADCKGDVTYPPSGIAETMFSTAQPYKDKYCHARWLLLRSAYHVNSS
ncbi:hypothetical protein TNCV_4461431 [Trichonephila clavipes]|nr:hypothetical protein TNCV_4461431 [Trichonephila clavipes]